MTYFDFPKQNPAQHRLLRLLPISLLKSDLHDSLHTVSTINMMQRTILASRPLIAARSRLFHATTVQSTSQPALPETIPTGSRTTETVKSSVTTTQNSPSELKVPKKTSAQLDQELREKLEMLSGGGGSAGVEYENGKAEGLKRGVKSNMFRVI